MTLDEVVNELKDKQLPTYGTIMEKKERLKKHYGIYITSQNVAESLQRELQAIQQTMSNQATTPSNASSNQKKLSCLEEIERLKQNREERRKKMDNLRKQKTQREIMNEIYGIKVDVDFQAMVEDHMRHVQPMQPHIPADQLKICVCVKKRPIFKNELASGEIDVVSASNPTIIVHECKYKVDGITKLIDNQEFYFDNSFSHEESNDDLFNYSIQPVIDLVFNQGILTVFAYGQTGSGKTYSMNGLQESAINYLFEKGVYYFEKEKRNFTVTVAMYEIYGGKIYDLLNNHEILKIAEDKGNKIQIQGLKEQFVQSESEILNLINFGNSVRTTHATKANDTSSRSHAICQIKVSEDGVKNCGKLLLVDLAGSERAQDCQSNNKERQQEGAEINKSLLALKECIRALDSQKGQAQQGTHIPFRQSKLTMVLRDSFVQGEKNKIIMLACICPGSNSAEHTLNTLRYAERLKDKIYNPQTNTYQATTPASTSYTSHFPSQLDDQLRLFSKQFASNDNSSFSSTLKKANTIISGKSGAKDLTPKDFYKNDLMAISDNEEDYLVNQAVPQKSKFAKKETKVIHNQQSPMHKNTATQRNQISQPPKQQSQQIAQTSSKIQHQLQTLKKKEKLHDDIIVSDDDQPHVQIQNSLSPRQTLPKPHKSSNNLAFNKKNQLPTHSQKSPPKKEPGNTGGTGLNLSLLPAPGQGSFHNRQPSKSTYSQGNNPMTQNYQSNSNPKIALKQDEEFIVGNEEEKAIEEECLLSGHLECVKEEAALISQEGELITIIEKAMTNQEKYDIRNYIRNAEAIARKKLQMYSRLLDEFDEYQKKYPEDNEY